MRRGGREGEGGRRRGGWRRRREGKIYTTSSSGPISYTVQWETDMPDMAELSIFHLIMSINMSSVRQWFLNSANIVSSVFHGFKLVFFINKSYICYIIYNFLLSY